MQSSRQITTTNKPTSSFFTGRMPFLSPNQQCQSTEGKNIISHGLTYPKLPTLSLTTNSSLLPWGGLPCLSSALSSSTSSWQMYAQCFCSLRAVKKRPITTLQIYMRMYVVIIFSIFFLTSSDLFDFWNSTASGRK